MNEDVTAQSTAVSAALRAQDDLVRSLLSRLDGLRQELAAERLGHFLCAEALRELRVRIDFALNQPRGLSAAEAPCAEGITTESETP